jgi:Uma2 family endonuclease
MASAPQRWINEDEYLAAERAAERKSEYFDGRIFAMAGATESHNLIVGNLIQGLKNQLEQRECRVYPSDMRVKSPRGLYTYPDVVIVCGPPKFRDDCFDTLLNPTVIIEVLSESTEAYDRGAKWEQYSGIESLKHYVLVSSDHARIDIFTRNAQNAWEYSGIEDLKESAILSAIGCELPLSAIYRQVEFPEPRRLRFIFRDA